MNQIKKDTSLKCLCFIIPLIMGVPVLTQLLSKEIVFKSISSVELLYITL